MKRLAIPLILLVVIVAAWLIQSHFESRQIRGETIENFLDIRADQVERFSILSILDTLEFTKRDGRWFLAYDSAFKRADSLSLENVLEAAATIRVGQVISQNPERQSDFQVDSLTGSLVRFYAGDDQLLASVMIGKMSPDRAHTYVRKPGSDMVYLAEGLLNYAFNRERIQWLDKTLMKVDPNAIATVTFTYPDEGRAFRLIQHDSLWFVSEKPFNDSTPADSSKIVSYLAQFRHLLASDFVKATDSGLIDFDNPSLEIHFSLSDGSSQSLTFGAVGEDTPRIYCRKPDLDETLVLYKSRYDNLRREMSDFQP